MKDPEQLQKIAASLRASDTAKGRTYVDAGVEPKWLANEIAEHCKMHGWKNTLHDLAKGDSWLVLTRDSIAMLVEGTSSELVVKAMDLSPVRMKSCLALNGILALTGAMVPALALTGAAAWRSQARNAKIDSLVQFVEETVPAESAKPKALPSAGSVADRMRELAALRDQGLVTSEEYEAKRQELLRAI